MILNAVIQSDIGTRLVLQRKSREDAAFCLWEPLAEPRDRKYKLRTGCRISFDERAMTTRSVREREFVSRIADLRQVWG
jgi:hypothetical protein